MGIKVTSGGKGPFSPGADMGRPKPSRPFGMRSTPFNPATGKYMQFVPDEEAVVPGEWTEIDAALYTPTPASTSRITMSDTSMLAVGMPIRYTYAIISDWVYYGIVSAISADAYVDVIGAPLDVSKPLTCLEYAGPGHLAGATLFIKGANFGATSTTLLATIMKTARRWPFGVACLVGFSAKLNTADSTTNPKVNVTVDGNAVSTNDTNLGVQPTASWVNNPAVAISPDNYVLDRLSVIEVSCTAAAGTKNAAYLTVECLFVLE